MNILRMLFYITLDLGQTINLIVTQDTRRNELFDIPGFPVVPRIFLRTLRGRMAVDLTDIAIHGCFYGARSRVMCLRTGIQLRTIFAHCAKFRVANKFNFFSIIILEDG
jgi:hypothetical protein